ncbi:MAG: hypothetical protein ACQETD_04685 [Pseudomonadota bacterium]
MVFDIPQEQLKAARSAHELFMVNLGALLLLGPLSIFLGIGRGAILIPMAVSALFVLYTWRRGRRLAESGDWFVAVHWRAALRNYRWLFIGFALTVVFLLISWALESSLDPHSPTHFVAVALSRIGVMPTLVMLFASFVIGNGGLNQVLRHEVPDRLVAAFPPPEGIARAGEGQEKSGA